MDTNVLVSGLRSRNGAAHRVLRLVGQGRFATVLSVPLVLEYESTLKRHARSLGLRHAEIDDVLDYVCSVSDHRRVFYLWRPFLKDPNDDMVLELAVESEADMIVAHNLRDFAGCEQFAVRVARPQDLLREIGELT